MWSLVSSLRIKRTLGLWDSPHCSWVVSCGFSSLAYTHTRLMRLVIGFGDGKDLRGSWSNLQAMESQTHILCVSLLPFLWGWGTPFPSEQPHWSKDAVKINYKEHYIDL